MVIVIHVLVTLSDSYYYFFFIIWDTVNIKKIDSCDEMPSSVKMCILYLKQ